MVYHQDTTDIELSHVALNPDFTTTSTTPIAI